VTADRAANGRILAEARFPDIDAPFLLDLRGWVSEPLCDLAPGTVRGVTIVLGELLGNAFRHARPPFAVRLLAPPRGPAVRVAVRDASPSPANGWELGRGLLIVRDLCSNWGVECRPAGKTVWADVAAATARSAPTFRLPDSRRRP
jgi:hypothetical protein